MTYQELVKYLKDNYEKIDASSVKDHLAMQFNITGEAEGAFYLEIADGKVAIEPYEYYDRDVVVTCSAQDIMDILAGKMDFVEAFNDGKIGAEGNLVKALDLKGVIEKNAPKKKTVAQKAKSAVATAKAAKKVATAKKETAKKEVAKKEPAKKETAKTATKAPAKKATTATKSAATKVAAKKTTAKK